VVAETIQIVRAPVEAGRVLVTDEAWRRIGSFFALSWRELDIVRQVLADHKEGAIARELGISTHTVHTYVGRAYRKMHVTNRLQLVLRVVQLQSEPATSQTTDSSPPQPAAARVRPCPLADLCPLSS
jgi:DNA-binding CsgD family transcriptional regulator